MSGETDLQVLIRSMEPHLDPTHYVFCTVADVDFSHLHSFSPKGTFVEKEGTTLIVEKTVADQHGLPYSGEFNCLSLSVHSSLEAVGLTAAISGALAEAEISANVVAAHYHDHVFVPVEKAQLAMDVLVNLTKQEKKAPMR